MARLGFVTEGELPVPRSPSRRDSETPSATGEGMALMQRSKTLTEVDETKKESTFKQKASQVKSQDLPEMKRRSRPKPAALSSSSPMKAPPSSFVHPKIAKRAMTSDAEMPWVHHRRHRSRSGSVAVSESNEHVSQSCDLPPCTEPGSIRPSRSVPRNRSRSGSYAPSERNDHGLQPLETGASSSSSPLKQLPLQPVPPSRPRSRSSFMATKIIKRSVTSDVEMPWVGSQQHRSGSGSAAVSESNEHVSQSCDLPPCAKPSSRRPSRSVPRNRSRSGSIDPSERNDHGLQGASSSSSPLKQPPLQPVPPNRPRSRTRPTSRSVAGSSPSHLSQSYDSRSASASAASSVDLLPTIVDPASTASLRDSKSPSDHFSRNTLRPPEVTNESHLLEFRRSLKDQTDSASRPLPQATDRHTVSLPGSRKGEAEQAKSSTSPQKGTDHQAFSVLSNESLQSLRSDYESLSPNSDSEHPASQSVGSSIASISTHQAETSHRRPGAQDYRAQLAEKLKKRQRLPVKKAVSASSVSPRETPGPEMMPAFASSGGNPSSGARNQSPFSMSGGGRSSLVPVLEDQEAALSGLPSGPARLKPEKMRPFRRPLGLMPKRPTDEVLEDLLDESFSSQLLRKNAEADVLGDVADGSRSFNSISGVDMDVLGSSGSFGDSFGSGNGRERELADDASCVSNAGSERSIYRRTQEARLEARNLNWRRKGQ